MTVENQNKKSYLTDDNGAPSSMRLMSMLSLFIAEDFLHLQ